MTQRAELEAILDNPNVQRYLEMLSQAEGTAQYHDPYRVGFGGRAIEDLSQHPNVAVPFIQTDGQRNKTTAAGKYQFLHRTWQDVSRNLGLQNFSARNQDLGALELMRRSGSLADVLRGDFNSAMARDGKTWASLPSSPYAQPKRSAEFVNHALGAPTEIAQSQSNYEPHSLVMYGIPDEIVSEEPAMSSASASPQTNNLPPMYRGSSYSPYMTQPAPILNNYAAWVENYIRELIDHV